MVSCTTSIFGSLMTMLTVKSNVLEDMLKTTDKVIWVVINGIGTTMVNRPLHSEWSDSLSSSSIRFLGLTEYPFQEQVLSSKHGNMQVIQSTGIQLAVATKNGITV